MARAGDGATRLQVWRLGGGEYELDHQTFGSFVVRGDGSDVACEPRVPGPPWRWQRFLVGQVLPLVATLRGHEVLHASAVEAADGAWLFTGPSGAGKTTTALTLVDDAHALIADDVSALSVEADLVVVHPGPGLVSLEGEAPWEGGVATELGTWEGERRLSLATAVRASPVTAVVVLSPLTEGDRVTFEEIDRPAALTLLGATFNSYVTDPERLARQFDVFARLTRQARPVLARVPRSLGPEAFGDALRQRTADLGI